MGGIYGIGKYNINTIYHIYYYLNPPFIFSLQIVHPSSKTYVATIILLHDTNM